MRLPIYKPGFMYKNHQKAPVGCSHWPTRDQLPSIATGQHCALPSSCAWTGANWPLQNENEACMWWTLLADSRINQDMEGTTTDDLWHLGINRLPGPPRHGRVGRPTGLAVGCLVFLEPLVPQKIEKPIHRERLRLVWDYHRLFNIGEIIIDCLRLGRLS